MRYLLTVVLLSIAACSNQTGGGAYRFHVYDENGLEIAETSGGPRFSSEDLFQYRELAAIIPDPEIPASFLMQPRLPFLIDNSDCIHILDIADNRVAVFTPEGKYLHHYGGDGNGPGEFRRPVLQNIRNGFVTVYDQQNRRITIFTIDGSLVETFQSPIQTTRITTIERTTFGSLACVYPTSSQEGEGRGVLIFDAQGDTLVSLLTPFAQTYFPVMDGQLRLGSAAIPFLARPKALILPDESILLSIGSESKIDIFSLEGIQTRQIRLNLPPERVREADKRSVMNEMGRASEILGIGPSQQFLNAEKASITFPENKSYWETLYVDNDGYFWLELWEPTYKKLSAGGPAFRVLSPQGEYLGDTRWPGNSGTISNGRLVAMVTDFDTGEGVPTIYQIVPVPVDLDYP